MDTQAGPSRLSAPSTPQPRLSTDRSSRAVTPTLTHKTSMLSAADTFATATDGEGYYTDAADISGFSQNDTRSRFESVPNTIHAHGIGENEEPRLSRSSSSRTTTRQADPIPMHQSSSRPIQPPDSSDYTASKSETDRAKDEAGKQIEPNDLPNRTHHRVVRHLAILGLLAFASIWGTLAREGLVALNTYAGQSITPLVWAQAVGCLIMGLAIGENRKAIEGRYPPAYIMITTGFCGSVTTFSAWMLDVFRAFGDQMHYGRGGLHNVMDALTQTAVTLGMAVVSVGAGVALSKVLNIGLALSAFRSRSQRDSQLPHTTDEKKEPQARSTLILDASMFCLGLIFWIASALLCGLYPPFRRVTFALVLAPPGAVLRWYLSRYNSSSFSKRHSLPLGTLAANLLATAVICAAFTGSRAGRIPSSFAGGLTGCEALKGLQDGFCGCLSTVSTLAVELRSIKPQRKAVRYAMVSWILGVLLCVLLVGAPWWSIGMDGRCLGLI